jgi:hypothetical protein
MSQRITKKFKRKKEKNNTISKKRKSLSSFFSNLITEKDIKELPAFSPVKKKKKKKKDDEVSKNFIGKWNKERCSQILNIHDDGLTVSFNEKIEKCGVVQAIDPFDSSRDGKISYFEIKIENKNGESSGIIIGLSHSSYNLNIPIGFQEDSCGYSSDGNEYHGSPPSEILNNKIKIYGESYVSGDIIGCGLIHSTGQIFFTKNGFFQGISAVIKLGSLYKLFPSVSLSKPFQSVKLNYGKEKFLFDLKKKHYKKFSPLSKIYQFPSEISIPLKVLLDHSNHLSGLFSENIPVPLMEVSVKVNTINILCEIDIIQEYYNHSPHPIEAIYLFPIVEPNQIASFKVQIATFVTVGQIK